MHLSKVKTSCFFDACTRAMSSTVCFDLTSVTKSAKFSVVKGECVASNLNNFERRYYIREHVMWPHLTGLPSIFDTKKQSLVALDR